MSRSLKSRCWVNPPLNVRDELLKLIPVLLAVQCQTGPEIDFAVEEFRGSFRKGRTRIDTLQGRRSASGTSTTWTKVNDC